MVQFKLDSYDNQLLSLLDINSRTSLAELSRKLKRSKQFILFRMNRLEKEGIITGYHAIIDMSKLGYFTFRAYFKFQQTTREDREQFINYVKSNLPQVWTITSMHGKWDYALFIGVKDIIEFHTVWDHIQSKYKKHIKSYTIAIYAPIYNFNRKFLEKDGATVQRTYGIGKEEELDNLDIRLIKAFAGNARQSALELSKKLKVTSDTVRKRILSLQKKKVIAGYKIGLNLEKLGYESYRVDFQLTSTEKNRELHEYCKQHKNIYQINKTIGGADLEIEVIVKDLRQLITIIDDIKQKYSTTINDAEFFAFTTYHILQYIPD